VCALKNRVAEGWVGSSHDRSPDCRPQLGIAYIISNVSHPNPHQSVLAAHAMRIVSRSSEDEPSTSVEEQCVPAAMSTLNRIALLSSDSLESGSHADLSGTTRFQQPQPVCTDGLC